MSSAKAAPAVNLVPGGFWLRLVAALIDAVIINLLQVPFALGMGFVLFGSDYLSMSQMALQNHPLYLTHQALALLINLLAIFLYFGWFYHNKGASPGKMIFNLKVLHAKNGSQPGFSARDGGQVLQRSYSADRLSDGGVPRR